MQIGDKVRFLHTSDWQLGKKKEFKCLFNV
jgi:DNA repair exonuclease SbcCD nuclease subunit